MSGLLLAVGFHFWWHDLRCSAPAPFKCTIKPRSKDAAAHVRSLVESYNWDERNIVSSAICPGKYIKCTVNDLECTDCKTLWVYHQQISWPWVTVFKVVVYLTHNLVWISSYLSRVWCVDALPSSFCGTIVVWSPLRHRALHQLWGNISSLEGRGMTQNLHLNVALYVI